MGTPEKGKEAANGKPSDVSRIVGCLLGGAVGDALGAPVEFMSLAEIRGQFGDGGITEFAEAYGRKGAITDDTQMTLFTAEGLIRAHIRATLKGICYPPAVVHHAYLRWLATQGMRPKARLVALEQEGWPDGWLVTERALWARRAPGETCLSALRAMRDLGERAKNDSKGCGTVTRVAPVGLLANSLDDEGTFPAFEVGQDVSALTHGHLAATMAGGAFALLIAILMDGIPLGSAIEGMYEVVSDTPGSGILTRALEPALALLEEGRTPTPEVIEELGGGWTADEALAITLFCAGSAHSFEHGVRLAVNHSGDSDSTGSMTGQVLGALLGEPCLPQRWLAGLELWPVIHQIGHDLAGVRAQNFDCEREWSRYPGW